MKSFLQGKKALPIEALRAPVVLTNPNSLKCESPRNGGGVATPGASSANVEVVKEGDKVVRLIVHCVCGERVEVECLYSPGR